MIIEGYSASMMSVAALQSISVLVLGKVGIRKKGVHTSGPDKPEVRSPSPFAVSICDI